jgi:PPM family protein phosphatase
MKIRPGIELANLTDKGCEREENEDYFCYLEPESEEQFARKGRFAVVADGMGGHEGGQVASRLAVEVVRDVYLESAADPEAALVEALRAAHEAIQRYAADHPRLRGMGTTCTALSILDGCLHFAHVGDSRLYLIRGSTIARLTHDHSYVSRLVAAGILQPEEAENHPDRHILTAAVGADSALQAEIPEAPIELQTGDILLLCTDGLHGLVSDDEILASATHSGPSQACRELVQLAKDRGGPDNITIQILFVRLPAGACGEQTVSMASGKEGQT